MQKSYQSRLFQKSGIMFVQNRQFCQLPFLPAKTIILAIDSNGAVGHLLTRSAVFVKTLSYFGHGILRQPGMIDGRERK